MRKNARTKEIPKVVGLWPTILAVAGTEGDAAATS
jgi:hypothetical protein